MSRVRLVGFVLVAALVAASVWVTPRRTIELVDEQAAAIDPSYVAYEYSGHRPQSSGSSQTSYRRSSDVAPS
jgi:hypothetical protein